MKSHYVTLPTGLRVHYLEAGDPSRPAALLLHGYPTDSRLWRHCMAPLSETYHVIAPDLPGHGRSDGQPDLDHDIDYYVEWLELLYESHRDESGHSDGTAAHQHAWAPVR